MQQITHPRGGNSALRLTALIIVAVVGGWAMSAVFASKPSTVGAHAQPRRRRRPPSISPMELMIRRGRELPVTEYIDPF